VQPPPLPFSISQNPAKLKMHKKVFSVITSHVNISWREWDVWPTKGTGEAYNIINF
jgi:hypothetical protein